MLRPPIRGAFFDVDETLITVKSMFRFLAFDLAARGRPRHEYDLVERGLHALRSREVARDEVARAYYRQFAGRDEHELAANGARWFEAERRQGQLFNPPVLAALRRHTAADDVILLVSGSFPPCVEPVARFVDADVVVCSRPEIRAGRYTGEIERPMIGEAKADAARAEAQARGIVLADSAAYGDHASDLPILEQVGRPVVVGQDPVLNRHAAHRNWNQLPAAGAARAAAQTRLRRLA